ncbi:hypothetical protein K450DRAFT_262160 [Umbelopsis ramanniana AG]|uniref:Uncharacterized protein n=1 Tax=Umbelopsis ramanniana AG TaxID=1314678 RepID=A0AAD5HA31_UMBRA|nr:uncharacterized protein K450DRAFT_262160 [Umbelopsis ramanniana AG]KAI8575384.1 hypothetical protein K450DRAFT_262160 [Umbelopsis ramanniana AG]
MSFRRSSSIAVRREKSSLESGSASIIARPPRRSSTYGVSTPIHSPAWSESTLSTVSTIDPSDIIDLQSEASSSQRMKRSSTEDSLAAVLAAAIQMSSVPLKQRSSLSTGRASVIISSRTSQQDMSRRDSDSSISSDDCSSPKTPSSKRPLSSYFFYGSGKKEPLSPAIENDTPARSSEVESVEEDTFGLKDLVDRGIHVKEIYTTMKTMVVPDEILNPMPSIKLERPRFARIN